MTFSIVGRCARTGQFGIAVTTSSICVGARCAHVRAGVGAVASQNITDPALGGELLDRMAAGDSARSAVEAVIRARANIDYRQLTAVDATGQTHSHTGARTLGLNGVAAARDCIAAGNLLKSRAVPEAMVGAFAASSEQHMAERLIGALEAGIAAGGEEGPVHSCALVVHDRQPFALVDLRIDWHDSDPVGQLRTLWRAYEPQMQAYLERALNPSAAPSYGVAGDP